MSQHGSMGDLSGSSNGSLGELAPPEAAAELSELEQRKVVVLR
jgi:hypothetical protein